MYDEEACSIIQAAWKGYRTRRLIVAEVRNEFEAIVREIEGDLSHPNKIQQITWGSAIQPHSTFAHTVCMPVLVTARPQRRSPSVSPPKSRAPQKQQPIQQHHPTQSSILQELTHEHDTGAHTTARTPAATPLVTAPSDQLLQPVAANIDDNETKETEVHLDGPPPLSPSRAIQPQLQQSIESNFSISSTESNRSKDSHEEQEHSPEPTRSRPSSPVPQQKQQEQPHQQELTPEQIEHRRLELQMELMLAREAIKRRKQYLRKKSLKKRQQQQQQQEHHNQNQQQVQVQ